MATSSLILLVSGIFSLVGLFILIYKSGWKAKDLQDEKNYSKDIDAYLKKRNQADRIADSRAKYSRDDILSGRPLQDNQDR